MSEGSGSGKGGIPQWQLSHPSKSSSKSGDSNLVKAAPTDSKSEGQAAPSEESGIMQTDQETLVNQASRFLQDDRIKDASPEDKLKFLESKGLDKTSIERTRHLSSPPQPSPPSPAPTQAQSPPSQARDIPPIITYPEFLLHSQKPPPIITARRLWNTAYVATGAAAAIYGLSQYLVKPMFDSLTASRHEFSSHTQEQLDELNKKLANAVSIDPANAGPTAAAGHERRPGPETDDALSTDSDPTELFHRDFGTQTSPDLEPSRANDFDSSSSEPDTPADPTAHQAAALDRIRGLAAHLADDDLAGETENANEISTVIRVLNEYLEGMAFPAFKDGPSYGVYGNVTAPPDKKDTGEVDKIRAEIRSMKGVLLSARNFPGSGNVPPRRAATPQQQDTAAGG